MTQFSKLAKLKDNLAEKFGLDAVMFASEVPVRPTISSGSLALDFACGVGGFPTDRVIEIAGAEGTGKTSLGVLAMKNFLDNDKSRGALILDTECKLTPSWVEQLIGSERMERVILARPNSAEQATDVYTGAVSTGQISFVMFDSIGGSPSRGVMDKSAEVGQIGGNALAITRFAQFASIYSQKYNTLTVGINQIRADMSGYNRHLVPGGHAWLHACALRLQLKRGKGKATEKISGEELQIGYEIACRVVKNGLAAPGRTASWWFYNIPTEKYGFGVDTMEEIIRLGILTGVIERKGGWYYHPLLPESKGEHKILGRDQLTDFIRADADLQKQFSAQITGALRSGDFGAQVAPVSDPDAPIEDSHYPNLLTQGEFDD